MLVSLIPPWEDQCESHRMTRMTAGRSDSVVMCNLINIQRDAPPCGCSPISLSDLILSLLLHFIPQCGALVVLVLALPSYLGCLALLIYVYGCLSCHTHIIYMWLPWFVSFLFLGFSPPESLPGDDVLCRLLPRPLPSVCFFFFFFPTAFVPDLFWCSL